MATAPTQGTADQSTWALRQVAWTIPGITVAAGDLLIVNCTTEDDAYSATISDSLSNAWTLQQDVNPGGNFPRVQIWTAIANGAGTCTVTLTPVGFGGSDRWCGGRIRNYTAHGFVGASSQTSGSGAPTLNITTLRPNSAVLVVNADWNAVDGASRTWRANAGALTEGSYERNAAAGASYSGTHEDAGAVNTYAVGLSAPTGQAYGIAAIEVLTPDDATEPFIRGIGTNAITANSVLNPTNLAPGLPTTRATDDVLLCFTESRSNSATCATPAGWTLLANVASGTASGGRIYVFGLVVDGTETAPTVTWSGLTTGTSGSACQARILSVGGVDVSGGASAILDGTVQNTDATVTSSITVPSVTTSLANSCQFEVVTRMNDTAFTYGVPSGTGWAEHSDVHTNTGLGIGVQIASRTLTSSGASGTSTITPSNTTSSRALVASFAVKTVQSAAPAAPRLLGSLGAGT
jgi:hypothetical protein